VAVGNRARTRGEHETCRTPGCGRPTQRSAGQGLSELYCKAHVEFHRRHGSYWHPSLRAAELQPYRKAARRWLRAHRSDELLASVAESLGRMMAGAGEPSSAYDLRHELPAEKARVAIARLGKAGVPGIRLIEITMAVSARVNDLGPIGDHEFLKVQIAKASHRLASGTHRSTSGFPMRPKYPHSAGKVLRILGHCIWDVAAIVANANAVDEVIALAKPEAEKAAKVEEQRRANLALVTREIKRLERMGIGPASLERQRAQLKRQYGIK
jgi:hypothetical protein